MEKTDWGNEASKLSEGKLYFKPESGKHIVKFLNEGEKHIKEFTDKTTEKVRKVERFTVQVETEIDGKLKQMSWEMSTGTTYASLFGAIALFGEHNQGLTNNTITLLVSGAGMRKNYMVEEALPLIEKHKERIEKSKIEQSI